jgi:hypothetical protein
MRVYVVQFFKTILGGNGREVDVCQFVVETTARDQASAIENATRQFCQARNMAHWSLRADSYRVDEADHWMSAKSA